MNKNWKLETLAIQAGYEPTSGQPRVIPITQSTTYAYDTAQEVADLFNLDAPGHMYSRISNPTTEAFENKMAALEGGVAGLACSSGQAATTVALLNIVESGDHIVAGTALYGGTFNLLLNTFKKFGIETTFVDLNGPVETIEAAFQENTKVIIGETIENPGMNVMDFEKISAIAKKKDVPFVVDNTLATPYLCQPLKLGADIVIHSASKYIDGHATSISGIIVDSGNYNWDNGKFPGMIEEDPSYHGLSFFKQFGKSAYIVKARVQYIRDMGCYLSPMNAWLANLGLETLHIRMERHSENALAIAEYLEKHPKVAWVRYPGLKGGDSYDLAKKYLKSSSGVLTFGVVGGRKAGEKVMNSLELARIVVHVADLRTSILHPASTSHRQLSDENLVKAGVGADMLRLSVGIENVEDIIDDLEQALAKLD